MKFYLITHAHTEQVPEVAADAWRLSTRGMQQAADLARASLWAEVDRVVVSSEPKTLHTVDEVIRAHKLPIWVDSRFDELRRSGWTPDYGAQVAASFAQPADSIHGWESVACVAERAWLGLCDLQQRFAGETLALVGHGLCLSILRAKILGLAQVDFARWQRLQFASYATIGLDPPRLLADFPLSESVAR